jgi:hypothetical protein
VGEDSVDLPLRSADEIGALSEGAFRSSPTPALLRFAPAERGGGACHDPTLKRPSRCTPKSAPGAFRSFLPSALNSFKELSVKDYDSATVWNELIADMDATNIRGDEDITVDFLEELAAGGPALELAIGTGRIALPLAARGIRVDGIELSPAMANKLRTRPGGESIAVTVGDMCDVAVDGRYPLIYVLFNSFFNVTSQEDQIRCFENVASHLTDDGCFVLEFDPPWTWMPILVRGHRNQYVEAEEVETDHVILDVLKHDPSIQTIYESHVYISAGGIYPWPVVQRYAWPGELDLMARLAGLRLRDRFGGWKGQPFTSTSTKIVCVYSR